MRTIDFAALESRLGYQFTDKKLLKLAFTHKSIGAHNNERLEFLGDALLGAIVANDLFSRFPKAKEGALTRMRANVVNGKALAILAKGFDLGAFLILGQGELKSGGHRNASILANTYEALIGAIYLDSDYTRVEKLVLKWMEKSISNLDEKISKDAKTQLQEWLQERQMALPVYTVIKTTGVEHEQEFWVRCEVEQAPPQEAKGLSRRQAEQSAARLILEVLKNGD